MQEIIEPISIEILKSELTPDKKVQNTHKGSNEIYIVTWQNSPNVLKEIGRLREIVFRASGGGTGLDCDLDEFDTMENPYKQLIIWDPETEAILGGYRYILGTDIQLDDNGQPKLSTAHLFNFADKFIKDYLPYTIELGRSFVAPHYQSSKAGSKSLFALDNLWDGLTSLMMQNPKMKYFFGKMTMYPTFNRCGRDLLLKFFSIYFSDNDNLISTYNPVKIDTNLDSYEGMFSGKHFKNDYKVLNAEIRKLGEDIPPLVNSYIRVTPSLKVFGTAINDEFGDVEETAILVDFDDMYEEKSTRYIGFYIKNKIMQITKRFPLFAAENKENLSDRIINRRQRRQRLNKGAL